MSNTTIIDDDAPRSSEPSKALKKTRRKAKREPEPKTQFPLPPKFTGPLRVFVLDAPTEDPDERDRYIRSIWTYSGPIERKHFIDSGWTTDDVIGSVWVMRVVGLCTITGLEADKWGYPQLIGDWPDPCHLYVGTRKWRPGANDTVSWHEPESRINYLDGDAIFMQRLTRFDTLPAPAQRRWLQACVEAREDELTREKREAAFKHQIRFSQIQADYARSVLREFEQQHGMQPTYQRLQREQPAPPRRRRVAVSPLQASLF